MEDHEQEVYIFVHTDGKTVTADIFPAVNIEQALA